MYEVYEIFNGKTDVWMTKAVVEAIFKHDALDANALDLKNIPAGLLKKISYYSEAGFWNHEGKKGQPIKYEGGGVYRIGLAHDLFRVYGFYTDESRKDEFIGITPWLKRGQKNKSRERAIIKHIAQVKTDGDWIKK